MKSTLQTLAKHQLPSGQFPTLVTNERDDIRINVHTVTPTYLICLILDQLRELGDSHPLIDNIIKKGLAFLSTVCYRDPITGLRVWHFNAFYQPDWEETALCSYLLYRSGFLTRKDITPLRDLAFCNETSDRGVGVWLKDPYSLDNGCRNAFDPVVSLAVGEFLYRVFGESSGPTNQYIEMSITKDVGSLYYTKSFRDFFFFLFGKIKKPLILAHDQYRLFHNSTRADVWYSSRDVWEAAEFAMMLQ
jgi:hypothetical protein